MQRIPQVRDWHVKFYDGSTLICSANVQTVNKRFARWLANERNGYPAVRSTRVTVSLIPHNKPWPRQRPMRNVPSLEQYR